jgi:hypothetical protein
MLAVKPGEFQARPVRRTPPPDFDGSVLGECFFRGLAFGEAIGIELRAHPGEIVCELRLLFESAPTKDELQILVTVLRRGEIRTVYLEAEGPGAKGHLRTAERT